MLLSVTVLFFAVASRAAQSCVEQLFSRMVQHRAFEVFWNCALLVAFLNRLAFRASLSEDAAFLNFSIAVNIFTKLPN